MIEIDDQFHEIDSQSCIIHHQDGWSDNNLPWLVCCEEEFNVDKHGSYTRFSGWNCPNETLEVSKLHPPRDLHIRQANPNQVQWYEIS